MLAHAQVGGTINGTFLREIPIPEVKDDHRGIAINKDGSLMCVSCMGGEGRGKLFLYALPSGDFLHAFKGHSSSDLSRAKICFAPATGNILVAEQSGGLHATECTVNGDFVRGFLTATTETGPKSSFGIAASESLVATASSDPPSVRLFRYADATLLRKVTAEGANPYLNCFPPGIRFTPDGAHFVVCHYYNSGPVSVFTSAGDYVKSFSSPAFNHPYDVDFARNGDVIVASWCGHTLSVVSRIDSEMKVLRTFGGDGSGPGQTHCPAAFAVSAGKLYAIDYKHHRVQVFE